MPKEFAFSFEEIYKDSGHIGVLQTMLERFVGISKQNYVSPYIIAIIYASIGEKEQAFDWLIKAYEDRAEGLAWLKVDPRLDSLRTDPRFADLMRRVGLES